jgi:hypothetical protein
VLATQFATAGEADVLLKSVKKNKGRSFSALGSLLHPPQAFFIISNYELSRKSGAHKPKCKCGGRPRASGERESFPRAFSGRREILNPFITGRKRPEVNYSRARTNVCGVRVAQSAAAARSERWTK